MKRKQNKFNFSNEHISWVKGVKRSGKIDSEQAKEMEGIFRIYIDPQYTINCTTCGESIAAEFNRLVLIMEQSIGCSITTWEPKLEDGFTEGSEITPEMAKKLIDEYMDELPEGANPNKDFVVFQDYTLENLEEICGPMATGSQKVYTEEDLDGKNKNTIAAFVREITGREIRTNKNRPSVVEEALRILNFGNND